MGQDLAIHVYGRPEICHEKCRQYLSYYKLSLKSGLGQAPKRGTIFFWFQASV